MNIRKYQMRPGLTFYDLSISKWLTHKGSGDHTLCMYTKIFKILALPFPYYANTRKEPQ